MILRSPWRSGPGHVDYNDAPLSAPPPVYLSAPAARPPAAGYSGTSHHQSRPAAGDRVLRQRVDGSVAGPRWFRSCPVWSPGPPCPDESRPH